MHSQAFDTIARAKREGLSCAGFLAEQLMAEREDRDPRRAECHIRAAHFPREKSPQEFDHGADSHVDRAWLSCLTEPRTPGRRGRKRPKRAVPERPRRRSGRQLAMAWLPQPAFDCRRAPADRHAPNRRTVARPGEPARRPGAPRTWARRRLRGLTDRRSRSGAGGGLTECDSGVYEVLDQS
ncbi:hypothetical protein ACFV2U_00420 [Streptomyces sp. NPDC059697]|uniref:hypothetical protein n=1 Tax=Streptomyces sp. NPDC059697 TaxID=3346912 RepID=UPI00368DA3E7